MRVLGMCVCVCVCEKDPFCVVRNSQIELRSPTTVRRPNKNPRLCARAGLLRATKQSAFFVAKTFLFFFFASPSPHSTSSLPLPYVYAAPQNVYILLYAQTRWRTYVYYVKVYIYIRIHRILHTKKIGCRAREFVEK